MKKLILTITTLAFAATAWSQSLEVLNAYNYQRAGELDNAKSAIDKAIRDEKTGIEAKTWYYCGNIYLQIARDPNLSHLDPNPLAVAIEAFAKARTYDVKHKYTEEVNQNYAQTLALLFNKGVKEYQEQKFNDAISTFNVIIKNNPKDTLALFNMALSAEKAKDTVAAKAAFIKLIEVHYPEAEVYRSLASIYKAEKDTAAALTVIENARIIFPENVNLIIDELNVYLARKKTAEVLSKLELACEKDPNNKTLWFALGTAQDKLKNYSKAETAYKRAIEIDTKYFDAYYNLGAMWFNWGVETFNKTVNLPASKQKEYDEGKRSYELQFRAALPYLEQALVIDPKDRNTMISLKEIYAKVGEFQKSNEMKKKLEGK